LGSGEVGEEPAEELSGEVEGEVVRAGTLSDSSPECDDELELVGYMSGALYESIFVVEISSTGPEILCRIVPAAYCFVVMLR
jgi:hypothetical protein